MVKIHITMNAQELRIGNWVLHNNRPERVDSIGREGINEMRGHGNDYIIPYTDIHPIPLTPEILEMAGFVESGYPYPLERVMTKEVIRLYKKSRFWVYFIDGKIKVTTASGGWELPHIHHLHQLQNLIFALTGTELNIQL
jgi:hypothetical protein